MRSWTRWAVGVAAVWAVTTATFVEPSPALAAAPATQVARPATELKPAVPSGVQSSEAPDLSEAVLTDRDEFSNTYTQKDGTHVSEISAMPINVYQGGQWAESKTDLSADESTGDLQVPGNQNVLHPKFKSHASGNDVMSVERDGYTLSFSLIGAAKAAAKRASTGSTKNKVTYSSVLSGTDLQYEVQLSSVKETLKLLTAPKSQSPSYSFKVKAPNLTASLNTEGGVDFTDGSGTVRFRIPTPVMWDSSSTAGEASSTSVNVPITVEKTGSSWKLTLLPSHEWLTDPARVYPVSLDPTASPGWDSVRSIKSDGTVRTDALLIGNPNDTGYKYWRSFVHFPLTGVFGKQILSVYQHVYLHGADGDGSVRSGNIYWANQINYANGAGPYLASFNVGTAADSTGDGLAQYVSSWVNARNNDPWLELIGQETPSTYTIKNLWTNLYITWADYPTTPTAAAPSPTGGARASLTPALQVSSTDPTGTGLSYYYRVATGADAESNVVWNSGWVSDNPVTVPAGLLKSNTTYYYHLYAHDGYCNNTPSNSCSQVVSAVYSFITNGRGITSPIPGATLAADLPMITGTGDAGAAVQVTSGGSTICTGTVDDDGTWFCQPTSPLPDGSATFDASESGTVTASMPPVTVTVKRPTTTVSCPGPYADGSWNDTLPTAPITCTVSIDSHGVPGTTAQVQLNNSPIGDPLPVNAGFSTTVTVPNTAGWNQIGVSLTSEDDGVISTPPLYGFGLSDGAPSSTVATIRKVEPTVLMNVAATDATGSNAAEHTTDGGTNVSVPVKASEGIDVSAPQQTITDPITGTPTTLQATNTNIGLPFSDVAQDAKAEAPGVVSFNNGNKTATVPVVKTDGSVQITTIIRDNTAPHSYAYPLGLDAGVRLAANEDGSVSAYDAADAGVAFVGVPWAKDANGKDVPTHFEIDGNRLTQVVDFDSSSAFPIVADPYYGPETGILPDAKWANCGLFDKPTKLVREYVRIRVQKAGYPKIPSTTTKLLCGNAYEGYLHIKKNHMTPEWTSMGAMVNGNWRDMASWAIKTALSDPDKVSFGRNTWCFSRQVLFADRRTGKVLLKQQVRVYMSSDAGKIITAYPGSCGGTKIYPG